MDLCIHSLKDLPSTPIDGLTIIPLDWMIEPNDVWISKDGLTIDQLPYGSTIATSSLRRRSIIHAYREDIVFTDIRGNIDTRLNKLNDAPIDGLILAQAGISRLKLDGWITQILDPFTFIPACGQGCIALEVRNEDLHWFEPLLSMDHSNAYHCVLWSREFLKQCHCDCHQPVGFHAKIHGSIIEVAACYGSTIPSCRFTHFTLPLDQKEHVVAKALRQLGVSI